MSRKKKTVEENIEEVVEEVTTEETPVEDVVEETPVVEEVEPEEVKEEVVEEPKVEEAKVEEVKEEVFTASSVVTLSTDATVRTKPSDRAPGIKNTKVDDSEKALLKYKGDLVIAVFKSGSELEYSEKTDDGWFKVKSGWIKL